MLMRQIQHLPDDCVEQAPFYGPRFPIVELENAFSEMQAAFAALADLDLVIEARSWGTGQPFHWALTERIGSVWGQINRLLKGAAADVEAIVDETNATSAKRRRVPRAERNRLCGAYLVNNPNANLREVAKGICCHPSQVSPLPIWQATMTKRSAERPPRKAKEIPLSAEMAPNMGEQDEELKAVVAASMADDSSWAYRRGRELARMAPR
jgi:hypothetical protein